MGTVHKREKTPCQVTGDCGTIKGRHGATIPLGHNLLWPNASLKGVLFACLPIPNRSQICKGVFGLLTGPCEPCPKTHPNARPEGALGRTPRVLHYLTGQTLSRALEYLLRKL